MEKNQIEMPKPSNGGKTVLIHVSEEIPAHEKVTVRLRAVKAPILSEK